MDQIEPWLREAAAIKADPGAVLDGLLRPGRSNTYTGEREGGKSHMAIGLHQLQIYRHPGSMLMTNMIFNQVTSVEPDDRYEGGYHIERRPRVYPEQVIHGGKETLQARPAPGRDLRAGPPTPPQRGEAQAVQMGHLDG